MCARMLNYSIPYNLRICSFAKLQAFLSNEIKTENESRKKSMKCMRRITEKKIKKMSRVRVQLERRLSASTQFQKSKHVQQRKTPYRNHLDLPSGSIFFFLFVRVFSVFPSSKFLINRNHFSISFSHERLENTVSSIGGNKKGTTTLFRGRCFRRLQINPIYVVEKVQTMQTNKTITLFASIFKSKITIL